MSYSDWLTHEVSWGGGSGQPGCYTSHGELMVTRGLAGWWLNRVNQAGRQRKEDSDREVRQKQPWLHPRN